MKREIKFRAWDNRHDQFCTDFGWIQYPDGSFGIDYVRGDRFEHYVDNSENVELMQFTGLHDKNGKEIYEGDIVSVKYEDAVKWPHLNFIAPVEWGHHDDGEYVSNVECWMVGTEPLSDNGGLWGSSKHEYEVIGNIYENPELL